VPCETDEIHRDHEGANDLQSSPDYSPSLQIRTRQKRANYKESSL